MVGMECAMSIKEKELMRFRVGELVRIDYKNYGFDAGSEHIRPTLGVILREATPMELAAVVLTADKNWYLVLVGDSKDYYSSPDWIHKLENEE